MHRNGQRHAAARTRAGAGSGSDDLGVGDQTPAPQAPSSLGARAVAVYDSRRDDSCAESEGQVADNEESTASVKAAGAAEAAALPGPSGGKKRSAHAVDQLSRGPLERHGPRHIESR